MCVYGFRISVCQVGGIPLRYIFGTLCVNMILRPCVTFEFGPSLSVSHSSGQRRSKNILFAANRHVPRGWRPGGAGISRKDISKNLNVTSTGRHKIMIVTGENKLYTSQTKFYYVRE